jgi:hypothetical protein
MPDDLSLGGEPAPLPTNVGALVAVDGAPFAGAPVHTDVEQGRVPDCWITASLAALAQRRPDLLQAAIVPLDGGAFLVRLHDGIEGNDGRTTWHPSEERVAARFYGTGDSDFEYANPRPQGRAASWAALIEKAFAQRRGGYPGLVGGSPADALEPLTALDAMVTAIDESMALEQLEGLLRYGCDRAHPMVLTTHAQTGGTLQPEHGYAVLDAFRDDDDQPRVRLYNPLGRRGLGDGCVADYALADVQPAVGALFLARV